MRSFLFETFNSKDKNLYLIYEDNALNEKKHFHNFIEIVYVATGCMKHVVDGKTYECYRGDCILIDINSTHSFEVEPHTAYFNLCLKFDDVFEKTISPFILENKTEIKNTILSFNGDDRREIESILRSMYIEQMNQLIGNEKIFESYFNILSVKLERKFYNNGSESYDNWNEVITYIQNNIDEQLSLRSVASKCFYNPSYFSRLFKSKMGTTFISYVNNLKIAKAKEYLTNTQMSIDEISKSLGFSSIQTFYKTFSSFDKLSPIKYREKNGKN